jgi:hypothetical protein
VFSLYNVAAYQVAWFAVLIGAARGMAWAGAAVALLVCAVHFALRRDAIELRLMGLCLALGLIVDSTLSLSGQVRFEAWSPGFAPYWMTTLWLAFATTLNHSLRWLMVRPALAAIVGAIGGPLAYLAGARLGALDIATPLTALPLLALLWAASMLLLSFGVLRGSTARAAREVPA